MCVKEIDNRRGRKMQKTQNEKFGIFLTQMRKEKNFTQKELAEQLFVSDKTVSKWE